MQSDDENPASPPSTPSSAPIATDFPRPRPSSETSPGLKSVPSQPQNSAPTSSANSGPLNLTPQELDDIWTASEKNSSARAMTLSEWSTSLARGIKADVAKVEMERRAQAATLAKEKGIPVEEARQRLKAERLAELDRQEKAQQAEWDAKSPEERAVLRFLSKR